MRVLDGAGVRGLAAIPPVRGRIIRPLIETPPPGAARGAGRRRPRLGRGPDQPRSEVPPQSHPARAAAAAGRLVPRPTSCPRWRGVARLAREMRGRARPRGVADELGRLAVVEAGALTLPRGGAGRRCPAVAAEVAAPGRRAPRQPGAAARLGASWAAARPGDPARRAARSGWAASRRGERRPRPRGRAAAAGADGARRWRARAASSCRRSAGRCRRGCCRRPATRSPRTADRVAFDAADLPRALRVRPRRRGDRFHGVRGR